MILTCVHREKEKGIDTHMCTYTHPETIEVYNCEANKKVPASKCVGKLI